MSLTRRGFLRLLVLAPLGAIALVKGRVTAPVVPSILPPANPLFSGQLGQWEGVRFIERAQSELKTRMVEQIDRDVFVAFIEGRRTRSVHKPPDLSDRLA